MTSSKKDSEARVDWESQAKELLKKFEQNEEDASLGKPYVQAWEIFAKALSAAFEKGREAR